MASVRQTGADPIRGEPDASGPLSAGGRAGAAFDCEADEGIRAAVVAAGACVGAGALAEIAGEDTAAGADIAEEPGAPGTRSWASRGAPTAAEPAPEFRGRPGGGATKTVARGV